ncbi:MAG: 30S ribosomal protein S20 [Anaerolineae bacterium]|nr:30S ribosomal protein S20 [Anaerolineae bacterium]
MANTKSAKKRIRSNERKRQYNLVHRSKARTKVKAARVNIEKGKPEKSAEAVRQAVQALDQAASKGVIHKNNASRRKSRLMKQLAQLEAEKK